MKIYTGPKVPVQEHTVLTPAYSLDYYVRPGVLMYPNPTAQIAAHGTVPESVGHFMGFRVPRFSSLIKAGWIIHNPMTKTTVMHSSNEGVRGESRYWSGTGIAYHYDDWWGFHPPIQSRLTPFFLTLMSDGRIARARDEAVTRVFAKAQTGNAEILIDISQIKSLLRMIVKAGNLLLALAQRPNTFLDIVRASREGRRYVRVPPDGKRVPVDSLSGLWCELRFGWGPFLETLSGIYDAAKRTDLNKASRFTYRSMEEISFNETKTGTFLDSYSWDGLVFTDHPYFQNDEEFSWRSTFRAGILLEQSISFADAVGLRASAIPFAAWDLVPYSFIVDRFFNIGNWIRSLVPIPASSFGGAWVTEKYQSEYRYRGRGLPFSKAYGSGPSYRKYEYAPVGEARYTVQQSGYVRTLVQHPPTLPVLRHDWSQLTSLFNLLDVLFLAIQRLR